MTPQPFSLPKNARDLLDPAKRKEMRRAISFLQALQRMQLIIKSGGQTSSSVMQVGGNGALLQGTVYQQALDPETIVWRDAAIAAGGTFTSKSITIANNLIIALKATEFDQHVNYLMPLLGGNLATARVPLRDSLGAGIAGNTGFTNGDFSEQIGLQGNSISILNSNLFVGQLNALATGAGGMGVWVSQPPAAGYPSPMGCGHNPGAGSTVYALEASTGVVSIEWGRGGGAYLPVSIYGSGDIYGQSPNNGKRNLFKDGIQIASTTSIASVDDLNSVEVRLMGVDVSNIIAPSSRPYQGKVACFYMTDGTLTQNQIYQLHGLLNKYLMAATGRRRG